MISGLNRTAFDLAVYASQGKLPARHARLASGRWPSSTGRDSIPAGSRRKVSSVKLSSPPELLGAMSAQIRLERKAYYDVLEQIQKGSPDVTRWMRWFLGCLDRAFEGAEATLADVLRKARFWESHSGESFNERQLKVINRLLDGFEGKLTSSKWAKLTKCSQDTATRDVNDLVKRRILTKDAAGRKMVSIHFSLLAPEVKINESTYCSQIFPLISLSNSRPNSRHTTRNPATTLTCESPSTSTMA